MIDNKQPSVLASLDWWTIGIYLALLIFGWVSVCGASYNYGDNEIFSITRKLVTTAPMWCRRR